MTDYRAELQRPGCFGFAMDFLGDPEAPELLRYIEALEARARCGRPAVEPVPVSERLPGPEDCWPDGHEKVGCCWLWTPVDGLGRWEVQHCDWASEPGESYTHWLPYYALPVRTPTEPIS